MFISPAFAQDATDAAAAASAGDAPGFLMSMLPLLLIMFVFYIMVIRPQNRRMQDHRAMLNTLEKGDKVITGGGLTGEVVKLVGEDEVQIKLSEGVVVTAVRSTIMSKKL